VALPGEASAQGVYRDFSAELRSADIDSRDVRAFYKARNFQPLWIRGGRPGPEAFALMDLIGSADLDGLDPRRLDARRLASIVDRADGGSAKAVARAEVALSEAFGDYVQAMRRSRGGLHYESEALAPVVPTKKAALDAAAAAPSLQTYLQGIGWMHPLYAQIRAALDDPAIDADAEARLRINLDRVRAIPANPARRYVLVDAAAARLYMYEDGRVRDTMKVVVGKADQQTPMMAGFIRHAIVNPYWNVPTDLARDRIAPAVLKQGLGHLKAERYEILSDWSENPRIIAPRSVDWRAVAAGRTELRVRQLPGKANSMGNVKFMFPNDLGIYLHDTPDKHLMKRAGRQFSSGCVRLEDAARLGRWLFKKPLVAPSRAPEQKVQLPELVPVYITYLTAAPEAGRIAFRQDVYGRDAALFASRGGERRGAR
jgi:murein L,D-transpeptidase YcbB/YkuD